MRESIGLLIVNNSRNKLKGAFVDTYKKEWIDIYHEQQLFAKAVDKKNNNSYAAMISLSKNNIVLGIPFTYAASFQGISIKLYLFEGYDGEQLKKALWKLRKSKQIGKIVSIEKLRVELLKSYKPEKVKIVDTPGWVNDLSNSYFEGKKL